MSRPTLLFIASLGGGVLTSLMAIAAPESAQLPYHATEGHKTLGNWYTTLLNAHENPIKHYGDLDLEMSRLKLDQLGPIKQLLS